ncbi:hypothetical protein EI94DRAFT_1756360 [Lactarius quietus]|nr:hypothetical protein EI94DRAFT_1756360 [Lactarius quietus]
MRMWLVSEAKGEERSLEYLGRRLLGINLAAITTSLSLTNILYHLLSNPECIEPLCHEVETAEKKAGPRPGCTRCTRSIASYRRPSVSLTQSSCR